MIRVCFLLEILTPDSDTIFGSRSDGVVSFISNQATARCDGSECAFAFRGIGLDSDGNQMKADVYCHSSCNKIKITNDWVKKSTLGWASEGWTNMDNANGTGDHEQYR